MDECVDILVILTEFEIIMVDFVEAYAVIISIGLGATQNDSNVPLIPKPSGATSSFLALRMCDLARLLLSAGYAWLGAKPLSTCFDDDAIPEIQFSGSVSLRLWS